MAVDSSKSAKRKASEHVASLESGQQASKKARTDLPEKEEDGPLRNPPLRIVPFPEKPAVLEERRGNIEFRVVNNDGSHGSFIVLTGLKCIFHKQLPKMPNDYIARLVFDRSHLSIAIIKHLLEVVGHSPAYHQGIWLDSRLMPSWMSWLAIHATDLPNYNQLLHFLNDMQNHSAAWPFTQPVNRDEVPDYYELIMEPMDLSTMEDKHEKDMYPTPQDFTKDALLMFENCRRYNNESTPYAKSTNKLEKFMWQQIRNTPEWSHLTDGH